MKRVAIACELPQAVMEQFSAAFDTVSIRAKASTTLAQKQAIAEQLTGCDALVMAPPLQLDADLIGLLPATVKIVGTYSVGHDHLDMKAARARNLTLLNTPDVLTDAVAEIAILLTLGVARRARESEELIRQGSWSGWTPTQLIGQGLTGRVMGFFGYGRIARAVAARANAFGMTCCYFDSRASASDDKDLAQLIADEARFLQICDVLVLTAPLNGTTMHFLQASRIFQMKPSAIVVNIGRGDLVVDDDLIAALKEHRLFGAGLDVFSGEPTIDDRYFALPNVFMLPHIGSSTIEARMAMGRALITGLNDVFCGKTPINRLS